MALRVLSGMIFIPRGGLQQGTVGISFNPFDLANASSTRIDLRKKTEVGPAGRFIRRPASIVAVRQFDIVPIAKDFRVNINDTVTRDSITISWRASTARVDQEEIPFLIIGEVPDPAPVVTVKLPPGSTVVTHPTDIVRKRSARGRSRKNTKNR